MNYSANQFDCRCCGKCCQSAFFLVDRAFTEEGLDHLEWARYHGFKIDFREKADGRRWWGIDLEQPCQHISKEPEGTFSCLIYSQRPQMCRQYNCQNQKPSTAN